MADKSCFGLELTKAEVNALDDNTTPRNIMEFLIKQLFYSVLLPGCKMIITKSALCTSLVIYHIINYYPARTCRIIIVKYCFCYSNVPTIGTKDPSF